MRLDCLVALPVCSLALCAAPGICHAHDVNPELPAPENSAERTERYQATPARLQPSEGNGMPLVITGGVFGAVGAASIALAPICSTGLVSAEDDGLCFGLTAASGGVSVGLGLGMIAAGLIKLDVFGRSTAGLRAALTIDVRPVASGGALSVQGAF